MNRISLARRRLATPSLAAVGFWLTIVVLGPGGLAARQRGAPPQEARTARAAAPIDLTGYWVSVVTEDWRWRMLTPPKGDFSSVPLNDEGRRVGELWDPARDEAGGNSCKPFGIGNIMRMPGRIHATWQDEDTLKLEFDAGQQIRLLHFSGKAPAGTRPTWQGYSAAQWEMAGGVPVDRNGIPVVATAARGAGAAAAPSGRGTAPRGGSLKVVTTNMREGYLRKNGVPYSANAVVTEYFDRVGPEPNGDVILLVRTVVDDPKYLQQPFITSTHFKREADGAKWNPTPCKIEPPVVPGQP